jgi:hypothetical protein
MECWVAWVESVDESAGLFEEASTCSGVSPHSRCSEGCAGWPNRGLGPGASRPVRIAIQPSQQLDSAVTVAEVGGLRCTASSNPRGRPVGGAWAVDLLGAVVAVPPPLAGAQHPRSWIAGRAPGLAEG